MGLWSEKTWLITGASTGLGREIADYVLAKGGKVAATARNVAALADYDGSHEGRAIALALDVTRPDSIAKAVAEAERHLGPIDVLVNNAGASLFGTVENSHDSDIREVFEINFFGPVNMLRSVLPSMRARRSGLVINVSSTAGLMSVPTLGYYCASKFAVEGMSAALRGELAPLGIEVATIEPGYFRTPFGSKMKQAGSHFDYDVVTGPIQQMIADSLGKEPGDPARGAAAIVDMVDGGKIPEQFLLGGWSTGAFSEKLAKQKAELDEWRPVSDSVDYPEA